MAANPNDTKMVRDLLGGIVPQTLNEDGTYSVLANGDVSNVDFSREKLLRDHLGGVLPQQYFDVDKGRFVPGTIGGGGDVSQTDLLNLSSEVNGKVDQVAQQLAQKVAKEEVRESTVTRPIDVSEMNTATKQLFTGGAVAVVGVDAVGVENLKTKSVTPEKTTFAKVVNVFDGNYVSKRYISGTFGGNGFAFRVHATGGYAVVQKVEQNKTYTISKSRDTDRFKVGVCTGYPVDFQALREIADNSISGNDVTLTLQGTEDHIVIHVSTSTQNRMPSFLKIEEGTSSTPFVGYHSFKIEKLENNNPVTPTVPAVPVTSNGFLIADTVSENYVTGSAYIEPNLAVGNQILEEMYAEWDALVTLEPNYIKKTQLGLDSAGLPINQYEFKPFAPQQNYTNKKFPKILYLGGIHGHERKCNYEDIRFFKDLVTNWKNNDTLRMLRFNVHFIVVPIQSPWGYANVSRVNYNGVNLNRNYQYGWSYIPNDSNLNYSGESAMSEVESKLMEAFLKTHKDAIFAIDHHNFGSASSQGHIAWFGSRNSNVHNILFSLSNYLDSYTRKTHPWIMSDATVNTSRNLYLITDSIEGGLTSHITETHKIPGMILETAGVWGVGLPSGLYEDLQKLHVEIIGNLLKTVVLNNRFLA